MTLDLNNYLKQKYSLSFFESDLTQGHNSMVVLAKDPHGNIFVIKSHNDDSINSRQERFEREVRFYKYCANQNIFLVPKLYFIDYSKNFLVLEYLETNEQLSISTSKWIDYLITFIRYLNSNQNVNSSIAITASEFSINLKHLYNKLKFRIESYKQEFDFNHELFSKIYNLLSLELEKAKKSSNFFYRNFNRLQKKNLIVSPGDIGLHNSIKSKNSLFFFDFEYGGLDDPHRMILDFFYNPSNEGLREYAIRIKQELVKLGYEINSERLYLTMPFIRIKWILIKFKRDYITNDYRQPNYIEKIENLLNITSDQLL